MLGSLLGRKDGRLSQVVYAAVAAALLLATPSTAQPRAAPSAAPASAALPSFAPLIERQLPAVVNISTTQRIEAQGPAIPQLPEGSPLEKFFRDFFGEIPSRPGRELHALGSGFIISPEGYVVTNNHVIENATEVTVILHDDTELEANVVGRDPATDIALLKVESDRSLPHVQWGDSNALRQGDWVIAIGNPFGLGGTVTAGIVSARERDIQMGPYDNFLQTDASINRGNSGGPLFATDGRVVGVNTVIFSPSGGNIGIGFAVPSSTARDVVAQLREHGSVTRGWLGVQLQRLTPELATAMGLETRSGALVSDVTQDSPAQRAGLRAGDLITEFEGKSIENPRDLARAVAAATPGTDAQLTLIREGREVSEEVELGKLPLRDTALSQAEPPSGEKPRLGLQLAPLNDQLRSRLEIPSDVSGVAVVGVAPGSPAAKQGVQAGDVIVRAGDKPVDEPDDVASALQTAREQGRDSMLVLLQREEGKLFVPIPLPG